MKKPSEWGDVAFFACVAIAVVALVSGGHVGCEIRIRSEDIAPVKTASGS